MNYLVVDVSNYAHRLYYGMPALTSMKTGIQTHVIYGWTNFLLEFHKKIPFVPKDAELIAVFDGGSDSGRELVEGYKMNREEKPETLTDQLPFLPIITRLLGVSYILETGVEADHLIGQFALSKVKSPENKVYIMTSDKDMLQLVSDQVFVVKPENGGNYKLMDRQAVFDRWQVYPERIPDLILCMGDKSDNIPNIPGVGEKTAQQLIKEYGSVEGIYQNLEKLKPKIREAFTNCTDQVERTRQLVSFAAGDVRIRKKPLDLEKATDLCRSLDMTKTIGKLMDLYS